MKSNKEYVEEDQYKKIQRILDDAEIVKLMEEDESISVDPIITGEEIPDIIDDTFPGFLNLRIDPIKMNMYLDLKAPVNSINKITMSDIEVEVDKIGSSCKSFVDWEKIRDIYSRVMFEGEFIPETKIASGKPCSFHVPEYIRIQDSLISNKKPYDIDGGKVNFHHINAFTIVKQGQYIGDIIPELPGVDGINLMGEKIPCIKKTVNNLKIGSNISSSNGRLYADIDGAFKVVDNRIMIDKVLYIKEDVDYSTGDINFTGDVFVNNSIREGFIVECERDLFVTDSIEPTYINCGNDITVKHGIYGSNKYVVEAGGNINALHAENARLNCKGCITIQKGVINCEFNTLDTLVIEKTASIVGGRYHIQNGIIAGNIGNPKGKETYIYLGTDYIIEKKLEKIQNISIQLVEEMNRLQTIIKNTDSREKRDVQKFLFLKMKSKLSSLNNYSRALLSRLDKNENSSITVLGTIYPGTYIEICHMSLIIHKEYSHVRISLDKTMGEIKIEQHVRG